MGTHYPPGVDGAKVMSSTAARLVAFLRQMGCGDEEVAVLDTDMLNIKMSGMGARALMRRWADKTGEDY